MKDETQIYFENFAEELNCSVPCAMDVWYLRQRSCWTQELEDRLIQLHDLGTPPNMCEFGHKQKDI